MGQVSASKCYLLLECARALSAERDEREVGEEALYGTALHDVLDLKGTVTPRAAAERYVRNLGYGDVDEVARGLHAHAISVMVLVRDLTSNGWSVIACEESRAIRYREDGRDVRDIVLDRESHVYVGLLEDEIGGTVDLVFENADGERMVLDYKSGAYRDDYGYPEHSIQLRVLADMWHADTVAVLHCPRGSFPVLYQARASEWEEGHSPFDGLRRLGDGSMRPGPHCQYCPSKGSCPTQIGNVLVRAGELLHSAGRELARPRITAGQMHAFLGEFEKLAAIARDEIRARVTAGEVVTRPDGKVLRLVPHTVERLSKKGIVQGLGREAAETLFGELRAKGALVSVVEERLEAKGE